MSGPSVIRKLWIFVGTIVFPVGVDRFPDMSVDNRAGIIRHYPALSGIIRHYPALSGIIRHYPALSGIIRQIFGKTLRQADLPPKPQDVVVAESMDIKI